MNQAYAAMTDGGLSVFESATGTGKSLSLLCSALAWLRDNRTNVLAERLASTNGHEADGENVPPWVARQHAVSAQREAAALIQQWSAERATIKVQAAQIGVVRSDGNTSAVNTGMKRKAVGANGPSTMEDEADLLPEENTTEVSNQPREQDEEVPERRVKIFISSRTHSQLSQLLKEMKRIPHHSEFTVTTLGSRKQLCVNPNVARTAGGASVNDSCRKLVDVSKCEFKSSIGHLTKLIVAKPMDIEDMVAAGTSCMTTGCPYYASRKVESIADVVLVPYASLIQEKTRESLGIDISGNIVIIDEAHNILDAFNSVRSLSISFTEADAVVKAVAAYIARFASRLSPKNLVSIKQLQFFAKRLATYTQSCAVSACNVPEFIDASRIGDIDLNGLSRFLDSNQFARKLRGFVEGGGMGSNSNAVYALSAFLNSLQSSSPSDRIVQRMENGSAVILFAAIDAEKEMAKMVSSARSVILVGDTMEPLDEFRAVASLCSQKLRTFTGAHVIDMSRILSLVVSRSKDGTQLVYNQSNRLLPANIGAIEDTLRAAVKSICRGGIVLFVPSYAYADSVRDRLKAVCEANGRQLFSDGGSLSADDVFSKYALTVRGTGSAVLLGVINGSLSEGIDFKDDLCRCVIIVGMPYPNIGDEVLKERMTYFDARHSVMPEFPTGRMYYEGRCIKAINQSIGRAIRHSMDWSSVILLDSRYSKPEVLGALPAWIRSQARPSACTAELEIELKSFFLRLSGTES